MAYFGIIQPRPVPELLPGRFYPSFRGPGAKDRLPDPKASERGNLIFVCPEPQERQQPLRRLLIRTLSS